jgi:hypothetical protein
LNLIEGSLEWICPQCSVFFYNNFMAHLSFTPNLARHVPCPDADIMAATAAQLFENYFSQWPQVRNYVLDDQGAVRRHIVVLVDGLNIRDRSRLSDPLEAESEVFVFQALSGG